MRRRRSNYSAFSREICCVCLNKVSRGPGRPMVPSLSLRRPRFAPSSLPFENESLGQAAEMFVEKLSPFFCGAHRIVKKIITTTQICKVSKLVKGPLKIPNFQGWQGSQVFQTSQIARGCERLQRCQKCLRSRQYQRP